ncbi:MAG: MATE family efflux transporter [Christensenellales bacterium]
MFEAVRRYFSVDQMVKPEHRLGDLPDGRTAYGDVTRIALPAVAEMVLVSLISSADIIMVGDLGKNALAAVSLPSQPRMIMMALFFALNVGVTAIVARRKGEERRDEANNTLRNAIVLVLGLSLAVMALALIFAAPLMRLAGGNTNTPDDTIVLKDAITYFTIMAYALPVTAVSICINAAMRGVGNTKLTLRVNLISNIVNVFFNYLLIGGNFGFPRLEVAGAAIASVIGICAGAFFSIYAVVFHKSSYLHLSLRDNWRVQPKTMQGIIRVGGNAMVEQLAVRFGFFLYSRIIYSLGVTMFAAHNICMQLLGLTFNFADGLAVAGTSLVGQKLGAKRSDLSMLYGKIAQRLALVFSLIIASLVVLLRFPLSTLFINPNTPDAGLVISISAQTLLVVALMQPLQMNSVVLAGCLRGAGDNLFVASRMMLCVSVLRPLMTLLAVEVFHLGLPGTWILSLSEIGLRLYFFQRRFSSGQWKLIKV